MTTSGPTWEEFESIVERLHRAFHPKATVERNARLAGKNSKRLRQIDVAVRQKFGPQDFLLIVECKCWQRKIDVKAVEAFAGVKEDVGAHAGIMVSSRGFTRGARNVAEQKQINLYTFRDTKRETWPNGVKVPVVLEIWHIKPLALYFKDESGHRTDLTSDSDVQLTSSNTGEALNAATVCRLTWDKHVPKTEGDFQFEFPCSERKGEAATKILGIGFSTKFTRSLREGRLHFQGLVNPEKNEAHMPGFQIEVTEAPTTIARDAPIFQERHANFGIIMSSTFVETSDKKCQLLHHLIFHGYLSLETESKGSIPIQLAKTV